jgi:hypothetical protein
MYGDKCFQKYRDMIMAPANVLRADLDALGVRWTILKADSPAVATLDHVPGWRRLYGDKYAVVHVRTTAAPLTPQTGR